MIKKKIKSYKSSNRPVLRAGMKIGAVSAEDDKTFLLSSFQMTPQLQRALDPNDPGSIFVGRTGSGKSANILYIENNEQNVIRIAPDDLSFDYLSASNIIPFLARNDVDLEVLFLLLWRHVICVNILQHYFKEKKGKISIVNELKSLVGIGKNDKIGIQYLEKYHGEFWSEISEKTREIIRGFESNIKGSISISALKSSADMSGDKRLSKEDRSTLISQTKSVVDSVQIRELSQVINLIQDKILSDGKKNYYIVIDDLDTKWVSDKYIRARMIRALIENIKKFRQIQNLKIIISMRKDLLDSVYRQTADDGFQTEKFNDYSIKIDWNNNRLKSLVNARIKQLFKMKYTKEDVEFNDIFPDKIRPGDKDTFEYIIQRTQLRPRDAIAYVNDIIDESEGKERINAKNIKDAEGEYSKRRLDALCEEWQLEHPQLRIILNKTLRSRPTKFQVGSMNSSIIEELIYALIDRDPGPDNFVADAISFIENEYTKEKRRIKGFRNSILNILYKVGAIGVKQSTRTPILYSYTSKNTINDDDFTDEQNIYISPMLWKALDIRRENHGGVDFTPD